MEIRIQEKTYRTVTITKKQRADIAIDAIEAAHALPGLATIDEQGNVTWWEDTHGSGITHEVRKATAADLAAIDTIAKLREWGSQ